MTDEVLELLERQTRWQKSRRALPWAEKIRLVEAIRESILQLRDAPTLSEREGEPEKKPAPDERGI